MKKLFILIVTLIISCSWSLAKNDPDKLLIIDSRINSCVAAYCPNSFFFQRCSENLNACFDRSISSSILEYEIDDPQFICGLPSNPRIKPQKGEYSYERCMSVARLETANIAERKARVAAEKMAAQAAILKEQEARAAAREQRAREEEERRREEAEEHSRIERQRMEAAQEEEKKQVERAKAEEEARAAEASAAASAAEAEKAAKAASRKKLREEIAQVGPKVGTPPTDGMSVVATALGNAYRKSGTAGMLLVEDSCWKKTKKGDEYAFTHCVKYFGVMMYIEAARSNKEIRPINYGVANGKNRIFENGRRMGFSEKRIDELVAWSLVDYDQLLAWAMSTGL